MDRALGKERSGTADRGGLTAVPVCPLLARLDLDGLAGPILPGSDRIPAGCALRVLLGLKLWDIDRSSQVVPEVLDEGIAMFAGLNAVPKHAPLTEYSCRIARRRRANNPFRTNAGFTETPEPLPWLGKRMPTIRFP